jgi:8-oxo-dGTP pyrophosphatase MutT (NUDIX family)
MMQRYKVFFNDRTIFLTTKPDRSLVISANAVYKYDTLNNLKKFVNDFLSKGHLKNVVIYGHNIKKIMKEFKSLFRNIEAAGGVVFNDDNEFIGIFRRGKNDLPKGKLEKGESAEECAAREVMEECGIKDVTVQEKITDTFHIYFIDDEPVLKQTYWFRMHTADKELIPQTEEDITDIFRVKQDKADSFIENTYPSVRDVLAEAGITK